MEEGFIQVPRTARYHVLGQRDNAERIWVVLHGYGHLARFFLNKFQGLEGRSYIVAPEGLSRFYSDALHQRVGATWMTREDREHEIRDQIAYLDLLVERVIGEGTRTLPIGVLGFSQGAATALRWAIRGRSRIDKLVLWGGGMPPDKDIKDFGNLSGRVKVEIVQGTKDRIVPRTVTEAMAHRFSIAKVENMLRTFDGEHDLEPVTLKRCLEL